eukprot:gene22778-29945_t
MINPKLVDPPNHISGVKKRDTGPLMTKKYVKLRRPTCYTLTPSAENRRTDEQRRSITVLQLTEIGAGSQDPHERGSSMLLEDGFEGATEWSWDVQQWTNGAVNVDPTRSNMQPGNTNLSSDPTMGAEVLSHQNALGSTTPPPQYDHQGPASITTLPQTPYTAQQQERMTHALPPLAGSLGSKPLLGRSLSDMSHVQRRESISFHHQGGLSRFREHIKKVPTKVSFTGSYTTSQVSDSRNVEVHQLGANYGAPWDQPGRENYFPDFSLFRSV